MLIVLFILVMLAVTGVLWFVVKVALAVALGMFIAIVAVGAFAAWRFRQAWRRAMNPPRSRRGVTGGSGGGSPRGMGASSSEVTVLRPDDPGSGQAG